MPAVNGPVPNYLLDQAAEGAIEAHADGRPCYPDCPGAPWCDQLQWALRWRERGEVEQVWHAAAQQGD